MSLPIEFLFQNIGSSPIVEIDQTQISKTVGAFWNNYLVFSYVGTDGNRHRVLYHTQYKRWRNDDLDSQCLYLESDTNDLIFGDSQGLIHIDREDLAYDQANNSGVVAEGAISIDLQSPYNNMGAPANPKQYQNLQLDVNTAGQNLGIELLFDDGQSSLNLGNISNSQRGKINLPLNNGEGQQAYKVSLSITGNLTQRAFIYQASIESLTLPMYRRSFDTFSMDLGIPDSKFCRDAFLVYGAQADVTISVYYDDSATAGFTFTMPAASGIRNNFRQRLPAISFRRIRVIGNSTADFFLWNDCCLFWKAQCQGRGYQKAMFVEP